MILHRKSSVRKSFVLLGALLILYTFYLLYLTMPCEKISQHTGMDKDSARYSSDNSHRGTAYTTDMDLIFVGGMPRSGTTLMRVLLDAHPDVRCGEETQVVPAILGMQTRWDKSPREKKRLDEAGVTSDVLNAAVTSFIIEVVTKHGDPAPRLCNKDPFTHLSTVYLSEQFPNSKYLLMIRDGRAVVHSIISRKIGVSGFDFNSYRTSMKKWNEIIMKMYSQCQKVGTSRCIPVYYEQLALHPREWMERILKFLDLPWNETVMHHEDLIGDEISLSSVEKSTDQVIKPVNVEALSKWVGQIPEDVVADMAQIAPMLNTLGYDPDANPPNYRKPHPQVANNTLHIQANAGFWLEAEKIMNEQAMNQRQQLGPAGAKNKGLPSPEMLQNKGLPSPEMLKSMGLLPPEQGNNNMGLPSPEMLRYMGLPPPEMLKNMDLPPPEMLKNMDLPPPEMLRSMGLPPPEMANNGMGFPSPEMLRNMGLPPPGMANDDMGIPPPEKFSNKGPISSGKDRALPRLRGIEA